ncbi:ribose transport system substrate-binding protein [Solirubrobacter pauli]|uniref:Ribose transport system substrate-binding protein n=1 Tax=Solirubrobacter pauli TaxID=166793 RepID=A0A660KZ06_9ACTN|nr:substrate-binding domain-containing protein [Solirubrobacter pauli]RKQ86876.1 ribose transport system substrate-binding protein [Solirubrobacter pauli]
MATARRLLIGCALGLAVAATGCGDGDERAARADPSVREAQVAVQRTVLRGEDYAGPRDGPRAQEGGLVIFVAGDLNNGGIAGAARGAQEAAAAIGWQLDVLDGEGSIAGQQRALRAAVRRDPAGIILGSIDATEQRHVLLQARARRIPVVGWHAGTHPGPGRHTGLFFNVSTEVDEVVRQATRFVIAHSAGNAGVVIVTDRRYPIGAHKADLMAEQLRACRGCRVLEEVDSPIDLAQQRMPAIMSSLLHRFGDRLGYLLTINGAYVGGARAALVDAGRRGGDPPYAVSAGDGDASDFERLQAQDHQTATVAEPLNLHGWQLIDELNRARAGAPPSGYIAPPRLITRADVPDGAVFDPDSGYRDRYRRIWSR